MKIFLASRHGFIKIGSLPKDKAELFNNIFANQCSKINNFSLLTSVWFKRSENVISSINFSSDGMVKIIHKLDPKMAYGHNTISILMPERYGNSIYKPL